MKKLLYIFLGLSLMFGCSDDKKNDLTRNNLNGNVKSTNEVSFEAVEKFEKITKGSRTDKYRYETFKEYDDNGNSIEQKSYNSDGELLFKYIYEHDDNGNSIEQNRYNSDGELDEKWTSKYDDKGNEIKSNLYNSDGELEDKYTFEYDYKGNMIEMNWSRGTLTFEYDDKGNINEENYYNSDGELEDKKTYEYQFDDNKNWIKKIIVKDDKATFIIEREIEYYD